MFSSLFSGILVLLCWYFLIAITKVGDLSQLVFVSVCVFCGFPSPPVHDVCKDFLFLFFVFCFSFFVFCTSHVYKHVCVLACMYVRVHSYSIVQFVLVRDRVVCDAGADARIRLYFALFVCLIFFTFIFVCANTSSPSPP